MTTWLRSSNLSAPLSAIPLPVVASLRKALRYEDPGFAARKRFGKGHGGNQWLSAVGSGKDERGLLVTLPRETEAQLRASYAGVLGEDATSALRVTDAATRPPSAFASLTLPNLRPYQQAAAEALLLQQSGVLQMPCGAGKTYTGLAIAAALGLPTLVLAHTKDLCDQWTREAKRLLGKHSGHIKVQGVKACWGAPAKDYERFGLLIVDEAHHVPARTFSDCVAKIPAAYRLGLTATPSRSDNLQCLLHWHMGPLLYQVSQADLVANGATLQPRIRLVTTDFRSTEFDKFSDLADEVTKDPARNKQIVEIVRPHAERQESVLVITGTIEHAVNLADQLYDAGINARPLSSELPDKLRAERIAAFADGSLRVLVATTIADEGLDVPRLSCVVLAYPSKSEARAVQRIGRALRPYPGKPQPTIYDLRDMGHPILAGQARKRVAVYNEAFGTECVRRY